MKQLVALIDVSLSSFQDICDKKYEMNGKEHPGRQ